MTAGRLVKCVVWDLDGTLLAGVAVEEGDAPPPDEAMLGVLAELGRRGIVNGVASRNAPEVAGRALGAVPWPVGFVAPQYGFGRKSESVRRVADTLHIGLDAVAFVDDDPYERAEVAHALPAVLVLSPEEVADALGWPEFSPAVVTEEARARARSYGEAQRRRDAARSSGRSTVDFLRWAGTRVTISPATPADVPRLHELSVRTSRFNSARRAVGQATLLAWVGDDRVDVTGVRLADRFGDDGLVGAAVSERDSDMWTVHILLMSCRAMGRGVIEAVLACLARSATAAGARALRVPCRLDERNVPLRLALVAAGFRADPAGQDAEGLTVFTRPLDAPLPALADWVRVAP